MNLPPAELQKAAEHKPPFRTGSEMPLPRALGVCGEEEGELGLDVARWSPRWVEPGQKKKSQCFSTTIIHPFSQHAISLLGSWGPGFRLLKNKTSVIEGNQRFARNLCLAWGSAEHKIQNQQTVVYSNTSLHLLILPACNNQGKSRTSGCSTD